MNVTALMYQNTLIYWGYSLHVHIGAPIELIVYSYGTSTSYGTCTVYTSVRYEYRIQYSYPYVAESGRNRESCGGGNF